MIKAFRIYIILAFLKFTVVTYISPPFFYPLWTRWQRLYSDVTTNCLSSLSAVLACFPYPSPSLLLWHVGLDQSSSNPGPSVAVYSPQTRGSKRATSRFWENPSWDFPGSPSPPVPTTTPCSHCHSPAISWIHLPACPSPACLWALPLPMVIAHHTTLYPFHLVHLGAQGAKC